MKEAPKKTGANAEMTLEFAQYVIKHHEAGTVQSLGLREDERLRAFRIVNELSIPKITDNSALLVEAESMQIKQCIGCGCEIHRGKMFISLWVTRKYCSKKCMESHRMLIRSQSSRIHVKECAECGEDFHKHPSDSNFHKRKFCRTKCRDAYYARKKK